MNAGGVVYKNFVAPGGNEGWGGGGGGDGGVAEVAWVTGDWVRWRRWGGWRVYGGGEVEAVTECQDGGMVAGVVAMAERRVHGLA
ncbi:unnamed protein product [Closterium sp. Naga37s-1]|nr:unnamed protein product [Closterium sp. Naga37s-1]